MNCNCIVQFAEYTKQNLMNKLSLNDSRQPLIHPSPDFKNRNKVQGTSSPASQVKRYLENVKKTHRGSTESNENNKDYSKSDCRDRNSSILRKRIQELEAENNEFRIYARQYETLVIRNQDLEEQMLLLLEELELRQDQVENHSAKAINKVKEPSTKDNYFVTTEESKSEDQLYSHIDPLFSYSTNKSHSIPPFQSYQEKQLAEQNAFLRAQNKRIKQLIDNSIKLSLESLESKFQKYLGSVQEQLSQKLKGVADASSDSKSICNIAGSSKSRSSESINPSRNLQSKLIEWNGGFKLNSSLNQHNESHIDIEISELSESNHSFGKTNARKQPATPQYKANLFDDIKFVQSEQPHNKFDDLVIEKVFENISYLKENLTFILNKNREGKLYADVINTAESELSNLVRSFFPIKQAERSQDYLISENMQMRNNISRLSEEIVSLRHELRMKVEDLPQSRSKMASQRYLEDSYYMNVRVEHSEQFQQTRRKLIEVITIMRAFNEDYRYLVESSKRGSLLLDSKQPQL